MQEATPWDGDNLNRPSVEVYLLRDKHAGPAGLRQIACSDNLGTPLNTALLRRPSSPTVIDESAIPYPGTPGDSHRGISLSHPEELKRRTTPPPVPATGMGPVGQVVHTSLAGPRTRRSDA